MRLVHESAEGRARVLATDVETADSLLAQTKGLMGRSSVPDDYALVFPARRDPVEAALERVPGVGRFVDTDRQGIHMLFVRTPLDVLWVADETVVKVRTLRPWTGLDDAPADTVIELAGGAAAGVEPGDAVRLVADGASPDDAESAEGTTGTRADDHAPTEEETTPGSATSREPGE